MKQTLAHIADLIQGGRPDLAAHAAAEARRRFPHAAEIARLHGVALLGLDRTADAIVALEQARALDPRSIETLCNLGSARLALGSVDAALLDLEAAHAIAPVHPAVLNGLGNAWRAAGDLHRSRDHYAAATRAAPNHLGAWINLAAAELALGRSREAQALLVNLLAEVRHPQAFWLLGHALAAQRKPLDAERAFRDGARMAPTDARFPYELGLLADQDKRIDDAALAFADALKLDPAFAAALAQLVFVNRQRCDWRDLDVLSGRLRVAAAAGASGITPFGFLAEPATAAEQLRCAKTFAQPFAVAKSPFSHRWRALDEPVRVAFVSNGFGNHPTGLLTVAMFEALRDSALEIHLFATAIEDGKAIEQRLKTCVDGWHALGGAAPALLAERIHDADIEILVDLRGWGGGHAAEALALRPAPVQVGWLAYPGTTGAPWIDATIADPFVLPDAMRADFSEQVCWLPRCFQPSDPTRHVGTPPPRVDCGLPERGVVYACFNNSYKLNPRSVARMLAVLRGVPGSVLWLLAGPGHANDALRDVASQAGMDPARLVFMPKLAHDEYLARFRHADLFLDTTPYNAHTTASDAIWAGCPVLTVPGETFAARVAGSLNHHLGMPELIVDDDDAFVAFAIRIGQDRSARDALHARLAERRASSGLFDMRGYARDFDTLLQGLSRRYRHGLQPTAIDEVGGSR